MGARKLAPIPRRHNVKHIILRGFSLGPNLGDTIPGEERSDIPDHLVQRLTSQGKIKSVESGTDLTRETLLEQIALAPDLETLERLLSEDPEIVTAYEKRVSELEEPPKKKRR